MNAETGWEEYFESFEKLGNKKRQQNTKEGTPRFFSKPQVPPKNLKDPNIPFNLQ
jgi:hypothetical protein